MTKQEISRLAKLIGNDIPGVTSYGDLLVVEPLEHIIRAILLDRSADARSFYVVAFIQPLFVPTAHLALNLGWRVGMKPWNADDVCVVADVSHTLRQEAIPFLSRVNDASDVIDAAKSLHKLGDGFVQQIVAYSLARSGRTKDAILALQQLVKTFDSAIEWQRNAADRAGQAAALLARDPKSCQQLFDRWETETVARLGLGTLHRR